MKQVVIGVYERTFYELAVDMPDDFDLNDEAAALEAWATHGERNSDAVEILESAVTHIRVVQ